MNDTYKGISETSYLTWLEKLGQEKQDRTAILLPGLLLETSRDSGAHVWGHKFFSPLYDLRLFPFQGETPWVEVVCASWEEVSLLPQRLARLCTTAAGLWGSFRGGVILDLRWCAGKPQKGWLDPLARFLLAGIGELCPLFLISPGLAQVIRYELRVLDLQQIVPDESPTIRLEESLNQIVFLTEEEKEAVLEQVRQESSEGVAAIVRTLHRLTAMGNGMDMEQLLGQMTPPAYIQRKIGFESAVKE